jgi:hypothetical protein
MKVNNKSIVTDPTLLMVYTTIYFVVQFILVHILNIPSLITSQHKLVHEYYVDNFVSNTILDFFLVLFYLEIPFFISRHLCTYPPSFLKTLLIIICTTTAISGAFYRYFLSKPLNTSSFFSRWFHAAKWTAVLYDVVLLSFTFVLYTFFVSKICT